MRYLGDMIDRVRSDTDNEDWGANEGISDSEIVNFFNDAKEMLQGVILRTYPDTTLFDYRVVINTVAQTAEYPLPGHPSYAGTPTSAPAVLYGNSVRQVEYSYNGDADDYVSIEAVDPRELSPGYSDPISKYAKRGSSLVVSPVPNSAGRLLRATYPARLDELDIRRGTISSATTGTITLAASPTPDTALSNTSFYISLCSVNGTVAKYGLLVDSYNSAARVLTLNSATPLTSAQAVAAGGQFVTLGVRSSTHCRLPDGTPADDFEKYLTVYANWKVLKKDSSSDAESAGNELSIIESDIMKNIVAVTKDAQQVPVLDWSWLAA
jgi:hypothetical protein